VRYLIIGSENYSGMSGKSSFVNSLETDLFDLNRDIDFVVLNFNYEMLSSKQIGRKLSSKLNKTTQELYSGKIGSTVSNNEYNDVLDEVEKIKKLNIYYVDTPGTVKQIRETIYSFLKEDFVKNKWVIIILDHALLVRRDTGQSERDVLIDLQNLFIEVKKYGKTSIIQLTQMNREIEDKDRLNNPSLHYPMRRDLSSSDAIFQSSDYVIVIHRPEIIGLESYGPKNLPVKDVIYMHFLKNK
jgi:replicative DNA helicase